MKLTIAYGADLLLPAAVMEHLHDAGGRELKLILSLLADERLREGIEQAALSERLDGIAEEFGYTRADMDAALAFWRGAGVIKVCRGAKAVKTPAVKAAELAAEGGTEAVAGKADEAVAATEKTAEKTAEKAVEGIAPAAAKAVLAPAPTNYTGQELEVVFERIPGLQTLLDECQHMLGTVFKPSEAFKLVGLSDSLGLEHEHILLLVTYCKNKGKTSVSYIERTAYNLYNEGIETTADFEEYLKAAERAADRENKLRRLFGMGSRTVTPREKAMFRTWFEEYGMSYEMVELAYQITVDNTDKLSLPYLHKVLGNWHREGCRTVADVEKSMADYQAGKLIKAKDGRGESQAVGSFDTDKFYELALKRSADAMGEKGSENADQK